MPTLVVIAGPNGCGKSTLTRTRRFRDIEVIDPDAIARSARTNNPIEAGREALRRRREALREGRSFVIETTLAGKSVLGTIREARNAGYRVEVHYTCVAGPEQALDRIRTRVAQGGHDVPEQDAKRRFARSLEQLPETIAEANETHVYDNSDSDTPHRRVAVIGEGKQWTAADLPSWADEAIRKAANQSRRHGHERPAHAGQQTGGDESRGERAERIHRMRLQHADPAVRADAHLHLAALAADASAGAQMLEEAIARDAHIGGNRALSERLRNHATQMRQGQNPTGREAALRAVEDEQVRAQAREATHYKGSSPKARTSHSRNRRDDETPGEH